LIFRYDDFCEALLDAGFSMANGNDEGIFSLIEHGWNDVPLDSPLRWHSEDPVTDPWEWRMRVLEERRDIAYAKFFFRKAGFITINWYPHFLAARRGGKTFEEDYAAGTISHAAKRIYDVVAHSGGLAIEEIKQHAGFSRGDKSKFDTALTQLQMRMYITMMGRRQISGWPSTVFCTTEDFFRGTDVFAQADKISKDAAIAAITAQVRKLNPAADDKKINKFIIG